MLVVPTKTFRFQKLRYKGEPFEVSPRYGKMFLAAKMVKLAAAPAEEDTARGRYRRRDMRAEDEAPEQEQQQPRGKRKPWRDRVRDDDDE